MIEQIKKLHNDGKGTDEIAEELEVMESFVYRVVHGFGGTNGGSISKSEMIRVSYLFSDKSQKELADELETSTSYLWRVLDELKKDEELMEKLYKKWEDTVDDKGFEKLYEEFVEECKERADK